MPNLFPENYKNEIVTLDVAMASKPVGYRNGISFDDEFGDFRIDGKNSILESDGIESWKSWCINCIQTERYKHLAYNSDFGIEMERAMSAGSREEAESILIWQITEALMADPYKRTSYVEVVAFEWTAPDAVAVHVAVYGIDDVSIDITTYITKGAA